MDFMEKTYADLTLDITKNKQTEENKNCAILFVGELFCRWGMIKMYNIYPCNKRMEKMNVL